MKFSIFTHDEPNSPAPGKHFFEKGGKLVKETVGSLSRSKVETTDAGSMADFADVLRELDASQHLLCGVAEHDECVAVPAAALVRAGTGTDAATGLPLVARSNAFFQFPKGSGLMVVDADSQGKTIGADEVWSALCDACGALSGQAAVQCTSSSSLVSGSTETTPVTGVHTFLMVKEAEDTPRALNVLHQRLILAGHGRHKISESGGFLERSFADRALRVPSQPTFVRASVGKGVTQDKKILVRQGTDAVFDTRTALPDLTPAERKTLRELVLAAKVAMLPDMEAQRSRYLTRRAAELEASGMSAADAEAAAVAMLEDGRQEPGVTIHFASGDAVLVSDILKDPERYHRRACLDPMEPDYAGGRTVAQFYATPRPAVHSFAHSAGDRGRVYRLSGRAEFDAVDMGRKMPAGVPDAAKAWVEKEKQDIGRAQRALRRLSLRNMDGETIRAKELKVENDAN